jgi:hypothetical protein
MEGDRIFPEDVHPMAASERLPPIEGERATGVRRMTIVNGAIVFSPGEFNAFVRGRALSVGDN